MGILLRLWQSKTPNPDFSEISFAATAYEKWEILPSTGQETDRTHSRLSERDM